ncbi:MAG: hypothetical protein AAFV71_29075 [Cyanobacteria bacterium J06633_8]
MMRSIFFTNFNTYRGLTVCLYDSRLEEFLIGKFLFVRSCASAPKI